MSEVYGISGNSFSLSQAIFGRGSPNSNPNQWLPLALTYVDISTTPRTLWQWDGVQWQMGASPTPSLLKIQVDAATGPGTNPVVPTILGLLTMEGGATFATGTQANPIRTNSLAANTIDLQIQLAGSNAGASTANNFGVSQFDSNQFTVTSGFVQLAGGTTAAIEKVNVQTGTSPIVPSASAITFNGATVAAGTHPVRTDGTGANTVALEVQISQAIAATDATKIGLAAFNSTEFTVDANGFVGLVGGGAALEKINMQTGTSPIVPSAGAITLNGAVVAAGTNPVRTDGTGANTGAIEVQISQAVAGTDATKIGLSNFSSAQFSVDANGFVTLAGGTTPAIEKLTGDTGGALGPTASNFNILGQGTPNTSGIQINGAGSTLSVRMFSPYALGAFSITGGDFTVVRDDAAFVLSAVTNNHNSGSVGDAIFQAGVFPSGGDAYLQTGVSGAGVWCAGVKNNDSDSWWLSFSNTLAGGTPFIKVTTGGIVSLPGAGFTTDGVLYNTAGGVLASTAAGTAGQVLTSNGAGVAPTFQASGVTSGTFTPVITGASTAGTGTYVSQQGSWVKVGPMVLVTVNIEWTAHTGTGIQQCSAPFAANASQTYNSGFGDNPIYASGTHTFVQMAITGGTSVFVSEQAGSTAPDNIQNSHRGYIFTAMYVYA